VFLGLLLALWFQVVFSAMNNGIKAQVALKSERVLWKCIAVVVICAVQLVDILWSLPFDMVGMLWFSQPKTTAAFTSVIWLAVLLGMKKIQVLPNKNKQTSC